MSQKGSLGFYWPIKGEFDPRPVVTDWLSINTSNALLPVIVEKNKPMISGNGSPDRH